MWFALILGTIVFLFFEHPLVFWFVVVPLLIRLIIAIIKWFIFLLKKRP